MRLDALPHGWDAPLLSDIAEINPATERDGLEDVTDVTFIPMAAVSPEAGGIVAPEQRRYAQVRKGYTAFKPGDVIMAKITPCMENGKIAVVPPDPNDVLFGSTEFFVIRPRNGISSEWIAAYLSRRELRQTAQRAMTGAVGQQRVPVSFLEELRIPMAPSSEQRRAIDELNEALTELDAAVASLGAIRLRLATYRAALLKAAVDGTLTADWRAANPPREAGAELLHRVLDERRERWEREQLERFATEGQTPPRNWKARYREPMLQLPTRFRTLPHSWCEVSVRQLLHGIEAGKSFLCEARAADPDEWGVIKVSAMTWGQFDERENKAVPPGHAIDPSLEIQCGDLLLSRANTAELVGATRSHLLLSDKSMRLRYSSLINQRWLWSALRSALLRGQFSATATGTSDSMRNISQEGVLSARVPLPPRDEQDAIVDLVDDQLSVIGHLERDIDAKLEQAGALRQSILRHAFTGQLVPQDPNDEPASVLLERIAAQRAAAAPAPRAKRPPQKRATRTD